MNPIQSTLIEQEALKVLAHFFQSQGLSILALCTLVSGFLHFQKKILVKMARAYITRDATISKLIDRLSFVTTNGLIKGYKESRRRVLIMGFENHRQVFMTQRQPVS